MSRGRDALYKLIRLTDDHKEPGQFKLQDGSTVTVQKVAADVTQWTRVCTQQKRWWKVQKRDGMSSPILKESGEIISPSEQADRTARFEKEIRNGQLPTPVRITPIPGGKSMETHDYATGQNFESRSQYDAFYREAGLVDVGSADELEREAGRQRRMRVEEGVLPGDRPTHDTFGNQIGNTIVKVPGNVPIEGYEGFGRTRLRN